jgi:hypothetical protein
MESEIDFFNSLDNKVELKVTPDIDTVLLNRNEIWILLKKH